MTSTLTDVLPLTAVQTDGHLTIGGVTLAALAETFGTPLYVYDQATLESAVNDYHKALANFWPGIGAIAYAAKAWLCRAVAEWATLRHLEMDIVSLGEFEIARRAGFPPSRMHLHGNNKPREFLKAGIEHGVGQIVVDHQGELETIIALATALGKRATIWLRLNPATAADTHHHMETGSEGTKFGLSIKDGTARRVAEIALESPHVELAGVHAHIGSQFPSAAPLVEALEQLVAFSAEMHKTHGWSPRDLSPGGGWAVPYLPGAPRLAPEDAIRAIAAALYTSCERYGLPLPRLILEPGRELVARAGVSLYRVGATKQAGSVSYAFIDGGMADNLRPALYGAEYMALLANRQTNAAPKPYTIAGPFCESGDILIHNTPLPPLQVGDLLAIPASGAYQLSMANTYNATPRPAVVWLNEGRATLIQRRETIEDLMVRDTDLLAPFLS